MYYDVAVYAYSTNHISQYYELIFRLQIGDLKNPVSNRDFKSRVSNRGIPVSNSKSESASSNRRLQIAMWWGITNYFA